MEEKAHHPHGLSLSDILTRNYEALRIPPPKKFHPHIIQSQYDDSPLNSKWNANPKFRITRHTASKGDKGGIDQNASSNETSAQSVELSSIKALLESASSLDNSKFMVISDNKWENYDKRLSHLMMLYKDDWSLIETFFDKKSIRHVYTRFLILKSKFRNKKGEICEGELLPTEILRRQILCFRGCLEILNCHDF